MNHLLYLVYGRGPHIDHLTYSVLVARRLMADEASCEIIVYTDDPDALGTLPVRKVVLTPEALADWAGPMNFNHRRKIFAIKDALFRFGGRVIYCDADTFFLSPPDQLFKRVRAGHTVMHIREGHLDFCHGRDIALILDDHNLRTLDGRLWKVSPATPMFNAGVIGVHHADRGLLDEVVNLTDQIYQHVPIHTVEQFSFSACLAQHTKLRQCYDAVYHYWPQRVQFTEHLTRVLRDATIVSDEDRWQQLLPYRPADDQRVLNCGSETFSDRLRIQLRQAAKQAGVLNWLKAAVQFVRSGRFSL
jgi:hypothetical protein